MTKRKTTKSLPRKVKVKKVKLPPDTVLHVTVPDNPVITLAPDIKAVVIAPAKVAAPKVRSWMDMLLGRSRKR